VEYKPLIRIDLRKNRIVLTKKSLRDIGSPDYIILLVDPEERTLSVMKSDINVRQAHRIRKTESTEVELYSKGLLEALRGICSDWKENCAYRICGKVALGAEAIEFNIDDSVPTNGK
jgi:hypothetical protein